MHRVHNFSAGPAVLPEEVLIQAQRELLDWNNCGASVMEISHRGKEFMALAEETFQDLRDLLNIPKNYHILFLQGGARSQFAMVPMNLIDSHDSAAYVQTGLWGQLAIAEAKLFTQVKIVADTELTKFRTIPPQDQWDSFENAAYLHYVDNETINGVEFPYIPNSGSVPLVADMSSSILSRPIDVSKFGLIYASAQKNMGPAGITLVIIRDDLLKRKALAQTPNMFRYQAHVEANSLYNTVPTFPWYVCSLVLKWLKKQGGLEVMAERNARKAAKLYEVIDHSNFYHNPVDRPYRSRMNVPFILPTPQLEEAFCKQAEKERFIGLKGHRYLGGLRASIYNAMPESGVDALIEFMKEFVLQQGVHCEFR